MVCGAGAVGDIVAVVVVGERDAVVDGESRKGGGERGMGVRREDRRWGRGCRRVVDALMSMGGGLMLVVQGECACSETCWKMTAPVCAQQSVQTCSRCLNQDIRTSQYIGGRRIFGFMVLSMRGARRMWRVPGAENRGSGCQVHLVPCQDRELAAGCDRGPGSTAIVSGFNPNCCSAMGPMLLASMPMSRTVRRHDPRLFLPDQANPRCIPPLSPNIRHVQAEKNQQLTRAEGPDK